jgi:hypothetical protein
MEHIELEKYLLQTLTRLAVHHLTVLERDHTACQLGYGDYENLLKIVLHHTFLMSKRIKRIF